MKAARASGAALLRLGASRHFDVAVWRDDRRIPGDGLFGFAAALFRHPNQPVHDQAHRRDRSVHFSILQKSHKRAAGSRTVSEHRLLLYRKRALGDAVGGTIAWIVTRTDTPLRGLGYFTAFASFGTPFILYTIGWLLLLGKAGPVNYWLKTLLNQAGPVINIYSLFGMIFIESLLWSPFVFLMLAAAFRSMDPSLEEASAVCGARIWQTMRRVSLRLMLPAFFSVLLLIFIRSFEVLRDSGVGRTAGRRARAHYFDLYRRAKVAAAVRQRRRVFGAAHAGGSGARCISIFA